MLGDIFLELFFFHFYSIVFLSVLFIIILLNKTFVSRYNVIKYMIRVSRTNIYSHIYISNFFFLVFD